MLLALFGVLKLAAPRILAQRLAAQMPVQRAGFMAIEYRSTRRGRIVIGTIHEYIQAAPEFNRCRLENEEMSEVIGAARQIAPDQADTIRCSMA